MRVQISSDRSLRGFRLPSARGRSGRWSDEAGFTITESITGLSILFVVILALIASVSVAVKGIVTGKQRSAALAVAEEIMEQIRAVDYERVGHSASDPTLASGCSPLDVPPGSGTTDWHWNGKTYEYTAGGEPIAIASSGIAVVGGVGMDIVGSCDTDTLDGTDYEAWIYVTVLDSTAQSDPAKRVTILVEFEDQYDSPDIDNRAKISSLVFPGDGLEQALISVSSDANAGGFTLTGMPGASIDSFTATYAASHGELRSHVFDTLSGWADHASARMEATGVTADNPPCSVALEVATCAAQRAQTNPSSADDDPGTAGIPAYPTPGSVTSAAGGIEAGEMTVNWDGGSATSRVSACYGGVVGTCGPTFATPPFTAWPAAFPLGRHEGLGPDDFSTESDIVLPGSLSPITVQWLSWAGDAEAEASTAQEAGGATSKLTTPHARAKVPTLDAATIAGTRLFRISEVEIKADAPVGYGAVDADVTATVATITVAGVAVPLSIDPAGGSSVSASVPALPLGPVVAEFSISAVAGNLTEVEDRTGVTVTDSTASLRDALVVTITVKIVACGVGNTDPICVTDGIPPTTVADVTMVLDYGDVVATGKHRDP